jgi:hypothetical protein
MNISEQALEYLRTFGYVEQPTKLEGTAPWPTEDPFRIALHAFQSTALIPSTGQVDEATRAAMERPRCGFPDAGMVGRGAPGSPEEFVAFGTSWPKAIISYSFMNSTPDLPEDVQHRIIREALSRWSAVVPLIFQEAPADQKSDIEIWFRSGNHGASPDSAFDGAGGILAHAFFPPPNAGELAGDVHFDEAETWQEGFAPNGFDLLSVAVHELGHSLGLAHTSAPNSTMNPFYPTPNTPALDDRTGVKHVYREHIWIASLYRDVLAHRFDDAGLDFWVRQRLAGATVEGIVRGFCFSDEYSHTLASQLYFKLLDRAADPGGLAFWAATLRSGASRQSVMAGFLDSKEYLAKYPTSETYVDSLYRRLLDRAPDSAGYASWVSQLDKGVSRRTVAEGFLNSEEFANNIVREQYRRFLRREPDPGGLQYWTTRVEGGLAHQDLLAGFLASTEYRNAVEGWW